MRRGIRRRLQKNAYFCNLMNRLTMILALWLATTVPTMAQDAKTDDRSAASMAGPTFVPGLKVSEKQVDGEMMTYIVRETPYVVYPELPPMTDKEQKKFYRLVYNIKKVLPLAREARQILIETGAYAETLPNKKAREAHFKRVEEEIKRAYTPRMKKLNRQQGKLLIKLIDRETNSSAYGLVQAFLGPVRAGFYQAFSWLYGMSLKKQYDPEGVDRLTERVVRQVEAGQL